MRTRRTRRTRREDADEEDEEKEDEEDNDDEDEVEEDEEEVRRRSAAIGKGYSTRVEGSASKMWPHRPPRMVGRP